MRYLDVTYPDINNGLGFRVTVWVAGCTHQCPGCHNPWTWDYNQGEKDVWNRIKEGMDKPYIKGLTVSGGDPLCQSNESLTELKELLVKVKEEWPDKDIWLFTGYRYEEIKDKEECMDVLKLVDVLVDGPYVKKKRDTTLAFRGSSNQRILRLTEGKIVE